MIIKLIPPSVEDTLVHELPEPDMVVNPRHIGDWPSKFEVAVIGTELTLTRINRKEDERPGWNHIAFRVYSRNEFHYSFESTKYLYHGIKREQAHRGATEIVVKDGVETIRRWAFMDCYSLSKITIPNNVTSIEFLAFFRCHSLRSIELPPNLQHIGESAFEDCWSLKDIYIPPTVRWIGQNAFKKCKSLRIFNFSDDIQDIGPKNLIGCDDLKTDEAKRYTTDQGYYQWLKSRYSPLHNLCWDPSVTTNNIHQYIQTHHNGEERATTKDKPQFTPLHILAVNPSVTGELITPYLQLAPDVATMQDNKQDKTPLYMLCSVQSFVDSTGSTIGAYLGGCIEGKQSAFVTDDEGVSPFDYLCEKSFDDLIFLENKSFAGGLMVWWYDHCLDISLFSTVLLMRKQKDLECDDSERRNSRSSFLY